MKASTIASALDALESREDPLLCWGVVDGGLTDDELIETLDRVILDAGELESTEDLAEILQQRGLITYDDSTFPCVWRTRNGETLRLLARLRQIFLAQSKAAAWRHGAQLVADFRYARRPRAYPKRDRAWDSPLSGDLDDPTYREVLRLLTSKPASRGAGNFDIAGFQVRATERILASLRTDATSATVVGAGTGSGKTLAFYLPAFAHLVELGDSTRWTRVVAVYPRNELLRDQFSTAFANARKLDPVAVRAGGRSVTVGVLNKNTPTTPEWLKGPYSTWDKETQGYRCPTLTCPGDGATICGGTLHWPESDADAGFERLRCATCARTYDSSVIVLTRRRMQDSPPDMLFTTTEMLNRNISNLELQRVLGIGAAKKPRLMLLDEIHTYEGTTGAQAAMTIRRWHHGVHAPVCFVGLSATLANAVRHFSDLTGVEDSLVTSIEPAPDELEYEGAEYMVAVRSDPTSGASVLSTTIQTSMLLARTLDAPSIQASEGLYGTKAFVFTDDLDVTNRLFADLVDAEGQRYFGRQVRQVKPPLASMRLPVGSDLAAQRRAGQSWDLPLALGHQFQTTGLTVSRTTSQDAGVDLDSQVVVATASLEVGFDDPAVGAVLQHKAPRGVAPFLQRKGRAGRARSMRPYTAVILSDYGRDRSTYEAWDALFEPVLPQLVLPIRNHAVLRMQAALALIDWLADQVRAAKPYANLWRDLSQIGSGTFRQNQRSVQLAAADILDRLLRDQTLQRNLHQWVGNALQLPANLADEILWHPPRAVLLTAVPTLARRLRAEWAVATSDRLLEGRDKMGGAPLPDFFPQNLFSELSLPEGYVLPERRDGRDREPQPMAMIQMLREFAPGRVSRRFATRDLSARHWIPVPKDQRDASLDIATVFPSFSRDSDVLVLIDEAPAAMNLIRPDQLEVALAPDDVRDSSNASLNWQTQIIETGNGLAIRMPATDPVGQFVADARFHLHAQNAHVEVRRAALESEASVILDSGEERRVRTQFLLDGKRSALGATYDVDALSVRIELPPTIDVPPDVAPGIKSAWFRHLITTDSQLGEQINTFQLTWLFEALQAMLLTTAVEKECSLESAYRDVRQNFTGNLLATLRVMFRSAVDHLQDSAGTDESEHISVSKLGERLTAFLHDPDVGSRLDELVAQVWRPDGEQFQSWLHRRALSTLGHAMLWAAREICPEHDPDSLHVNIEPGLDIDGRARTDEVWLTETSIGGGGFIEALATRVRPDPRRFLRLVARALDPGMNELVDAHMQRLVELISGAPDWQSLIATYRSAQTQEQRVNTLDQVVAALRKAGVYGAEAAVVSCLANRVLRPGSTAATDRAIQTLVSDWRAGEERLGLEIPSRTWTYLMRSRDELDTGLQVAAPANQQHRIDAMQSLLWPRGWSLRASELSSYNPYGAALPSAPDLVRSMLPPRPAPIDVAAHGADDRVRELLAEIGSAQLAGAPQHAGQLAGMLVGLTTRPIETDFLQVYPRVTEVRHLADGTAIVSLELAELAA